MTCTHEICPIVCHVISSMNQRAIMASNVKRNVTFEGHWEQRCKLSWTYLRTHYCMDHNVPAHENRCSSHNAPKVDIFSCKNFVLFDDTWSLSEDIRCHAPWPHSVYVSKSDIRPQVNSSQPGAKLCPMPTYYSTISLQTCEVDQSTKKDSDDFRSIRIH